VSVHLIRLGAVPERCAWVPVDDQRYLAYHDEEWGVPSHDDRHLFEMLTLEGAQAGLSWRTILYKRDGYRRAFGDFDAAKVARFTQAKVDRVLTDPSIVRNRLKVESTVANAQAIVALDGALDELLWSFVDGSPVIGGWASLDAIPAETPTSRAMSKELKRRGFRFVGPTVCYSLMQATGMVNDHVRSCFRWREIQHSGGRGPAARR
jgi:DNA-3-methyladenine glycosylase I